MQKGGPTAVLVRAAGLVGISILLGIGLRLIIWLLSIVLPQPLAQDLTTGWNTLYGLLAPAIAPLMALVILGVLLYVILGRRR